jgi:hypothetical protein
MKVCCHCPNVLLHLTALMLLLMGLSMPADDYGSMRTVVCQTRKCCVPPCQKHLAGYPAAAAAQTVLPAAAQHLQARQ